MTPSPCKEQKLNSHYIRGTLCASPPDTLAKTTGCYHSYFINEDTVLKGSDSKREGIWVPDPKELP